MSFLPCGHIVSHRRESASAVILEESVVVQIRVAIFPGRYEEIEVAIVIIITPGDAAAVIWSAKISNARNISYIREGPVTIIMI